MTVVLYRRVKENEQKKKAAKENGGLKVDCKRKVWFFSSAVCLTLNFFLIFPLPITRFLDMSQVQWKMSTAKTCLSFLNTTGIT